MQKICKVYYYFKLTALLLVLIIFKKINEERTFLKERFEYLLLAALNDDHFGLFVYGDGNKLVQSSLGTCGSPTGNIFSIISAPLI